MSPSARGPTLLHYKIVGKLGEGGMGVVYKALDTHLDRHVAIKVLPATKVATPERRARFVAEAKAASALQHPNIITIHDISSEDGRDFIVMEYVSGRTLAELIRRRGLRLRDAIGYAVQIADALARAHSAGIIHRDIKPSNLMVDQHGHVKVLDFGLAKLNELTTSPDDATRTLQTLTAEGTILGTAAYMSPEQAEGRALDARSDIFSFGVTLYEMLTGRQPFRGDSQARTLTAVLHSDPAPLGEGVPLEVQRLILRCLRKDPARRWQTMADLKVALEEIRDYPESGRLPAAQQLRRRGWRWKGIITAITVVIAAVSGAVWYSGQPSTSPEVYSSVPITSYTGQQISPTFSPDGRQIAFTWCRNGGCAVYVKQIGVEEPYRVSAAPDNASLPQWSPDGSYIAFQRLTGESEPRLYYVVVPQRGGAERPVADFPRPQPIGNVRSSRSITWSGDSKTLIVEGADAPEQHSSLFEVAFAGGIRGRVLQASLGNAVVEPALSPDARWLAYRRVQSVWHSDVYIVRMQDGKPSGLPVRLTSGPQPSATPVWLSDGSELLFASARQLWRISVNGGTQPIPVHLPGEASASFAMSRQGQLVYSRATPAEADIYRITRTPAGAWVPGGQFISSTWPDTEPRFSPDGSRIALSSSRSGSSQIWVFNRDGSNPISLTPEGPLNAGHPRWSPDGRMIAFYATLGDNVEVFVVDVRGGAPRRLTNNPGRDVNPEWSCDANFVYYMSQHGISAGDTFRIPVSGGSPAPVNLREVAFETPDCKYLVNAAGWPDRYRLLARPLSGGQFKVIAPGMHPTAGFSVFSEGVYYVGASETDGKFPIIFRSRNGLVREIAKIESPFWGFTVSPDQKTILYVSGRAGDTNLHLVEDFE
jgi:serine/threonine protein kinase